MFKGCEVNFLVFLKSFLIHFYITQCSNQTPTDLQPRIILKQGDSTLFNIYMQTNLNNLNSVNNLSFLSQRSGLLFVSLWFPIQR